MRKGGIRQAGAKVEELEHVPIGHQRRSGGHDHGGAVPIRADEIVL